MPTPPINNLKTTKSKTPNLLRSQSGNTRWVNDRKNKRARSPFRSYFKVYPPSRKEKYFSSDSPLTNAKSCLSTCKTSSSKRWPPAVAQCKATPNTSQTTSSSKNLNSYKPLTFTTSFPIRLTTLCSPRTSTMIRFFSAEVSTLTSSTSAMKPLFMKSKATKKSDLTVPVHFPTKITFWASNLINWSTWIKKGTHTWAFSFPWVGFLMFTFSVGEAKTTKPSLTAKSTAYMNVNYWLLRKMDRNPANESASLNWLFFDLQKQNLRLWRLHQLEKTFQKYINLRPD